MINKLEEIIGYSFVNKKLVKQAMVHSSMTSNLSENYERLEFLGDRVLGVCAAALLYKTFPTEKEGGLSQRQVALVCKETVAEVALKIGLDKFMIVDNDSIRKKDNVLCDVCEALIGAIFLDGGFEKAADFVNAYWGDLLKKDITPPKDAKTRLQEAAHIKELSAPVYKIVSRSGTEHEPIFEVSVKVGNLKIQKGTGRSKKLAEQEAAAKMLDILDV